jgi:ATP-dependent Clp protease ATP-binding subunit ClpC
LSRRVNREKSSARALFYRLARRADRRRSARRRPDTRIRLRRLTPRASHTPSFVRSSVSFPGISLKEARIEVEKIIGRGSGFVAVEIPFTPRAKRVLELALEEARQLGHNYIGTEHLLLGLLREGEGVAARVLENLDADPSKIRSQVIRMVGESQEAVGAAPGAGGAAGGSKTPTLEEFGSDLTKQAEEAKLDPCIGRANEIVRVTQILGRRTKNNPCLIGEPGVGKSAIAEGLAQKIAANDVPETLEGKRMMTLDMGLLVAGTKYRGEFEERLKKLMDEVKADDDIILFIDEVHTLIGAGAAEGAIDAANILKPALARGELQCIGATTVDEYRKHIEKDPALERRFQPVQVPEPSVDETIQIIQGLRERYETHHKLRYTDEAIEAAAKFAHQYISDRFLPDKAIDLIDEAGSRVRLAHAALPEEAKELDKELKALLKEKDTAIRSQDFEAAGALRDKEVELKTEISKITKAKQEENKANIEAGGGDSGPTVHEARHLRHRRVLDRHPGGQGFRRRGGPADEHGGDAPRAPHRPGGSRRRVLARDPPRAHRAEEPQPPRGVVHLLRAHRRG